MGLYMYLYMVCLFGTALSGAVTIFLFVKLDIKTALRTLGKRRKQKRTKSRRKRRNTMTCTGICVRPCNIRTGQKTALLHLESEKFRVVREVLLVHTEEVI